MEEGEDVDVTLEEGRAWEMVARMGAPGWGLLVTSLSEELHASRRPVEKSPGRDGKDHVSAICRGKGSGSD